MKILIISDYNAPYAGNFIESIKLLMESLKRDNHSVSFLLQQNASDKDWIDEIEDKNNINYYNKNSFFDIYKKLKVVGNEKDISIVYCHFCRPKTQIAIKLYTLLHRKKLVSHFHNHCKNSKNLFKKILYRVGYIFYEGDLNIGCSKSVMESMPYKKRKCTYVENCINFKRLETSRQINLRNNDSNFVVLMFGFDYYRKGVDLAVKAISELNDENIILAISLAANREQVENKIRKILGEIPKNIIFLDPIDDVGSYYKASDLFLSAAREEGFCYSLVEAVYCDSQIISSNIPGVPKKIPGEIVFESGNYIDLKKKIIEAKKNKDDNRHEARNYVIKKYGIASWVEGIKNELYKVVE